MPIVKAIILNSPPYADMVMQSGLFADWNWPITLKAFSGGTQIPTDTGFQREGILSVYVMTLGRRDPFKAKNNFQFIARYSYTFSESRKWELFYILGELDIRERNGFCYVFERRDFEESPVGRALLNPRAMITDLI